ncbi:hypothetical protein AB6A40_008748 [Gnathostoma spinigerum]|uniref:Uncharacterized protein n=1 Tax=Gnathostoma spinigerum TaxID=75299 RepID=A0ABD6EXQ2_9BILA
MASESKRANHPPDSRETSLVVVLTTMDARCSVMFLLFASTVSLEMVDDRPLHVQKPNQMKRFYAWEEGKRTEPMQNEYEESLPRLYTWSKRHAGRADREAERALLHRLFSGELVY